MQAEFFSVRLEGAGVVGIAISTKHADQRYECTTLYERELAVGRGPEPVRRVSPPSRTALAQVGAMCEPVEPLEIRLQHICVALAFAARR